MNNNIKIKLCLVGYEMDYAQTVTYVALKSYNGLAPRLWNILEQEKTSNSKLLILNFKPFHNLWNAYFNYL